MEKVKVIKSGNAAVYIVNPVKIDPLSVQKRVIAGQVSRALQNIEKARERRDGSCQ